MKVISSERAVAQWRAIVRQDPRLAMRVADRFFNEQAPLASFLVWMMRAGTTPPEDSNPSPEMPTEFSRGELILMDYAAMLLELFRRESGRPLPTVEMEELEPRFQALMMRQTDSSTTAPSPASSQPNLFSGLLFVLHSEADSLPEESAMVLPPLIYCMVELFNTLTSSSEDREGALVENWTADRIEEALSVAGDPMRRDALAAANRFRSELVPRLIRAVERVMSVEPAPDSEGDILWIHALFLLADWAEPTAADLAVRFFSADSEALRRLPDPLVRNFAAELMASLLRNEPSRLLEIARSPSTDVGIRGDAIRALGFLGARKQLERPVLLEHLRTLIRGGVVRNSTPEWTVLVGLVMDAGLRELVPDLEPAFRQGWVNEQFFSWESVQELADSPDDRWPQFVQSGPPWSDIAETTGWLDEDATLSRDFSDPSGFSSSSGRFLDEPPGPFRAPPSVGRNDPCPCGSGRKFKKCCGA